jgi:hypothetical protein
VPLLADFSYEQTSKVTGGTAASKMKAAGASQEIRTSVSVKGDRLMHGDDVHAQVFDLAKETVTVIDYQQETWQIMTFAEISKALDEISKKAKDDPKGEVQVKVSSTAGTTLTADIRETGKRPHQMSITMEMRMAPKVAGYRESADLLRRLEEKLTWNPDQSVAMPTSILAATFGYTRARRGMAEVCKEMSKVEGMPSLVEIRMTEDQPVFEMTSELSNFSTATIEESRFSVPAGFKKVDSDSRWLLP